MAPDLNPNITALNALCIRHDISIQVSPNILLCDRKDYRQVDITIDNKTFTFFVDDEYDDFKFNYPLLNFCLVLRELEDYEYSDDFLTWCAERQFDASDMKLRDYYMSLDKIYTEIEPVLGEINSFIPSMDFEFAMGEARVLREENW